MGRNGDFETETEQVDGDGVYVVAQDALGLRQRVVVTQREVIVGRADFGGDEDVGARHAGVGDAQPDADLVPVRVCTVEPPPAQPKPGRGEVAMETAGRLGIRRVVPGAEPDPRHAQARVRGQVGAREQLPVKGGGPVANQQQRAGGSCQPPHGHGGPEQAAGGGGGGRGYGPAGGGGRPTNGGAGINFWICC